jgi:hypothetical protein
MLKARTRRSHRINVATSGLAGEENIVESTSMLYEIIIDSHSFQLLAALLRALESDHERCYRAKRSSKVQQSTIRHVHVESTLCLFGEYLWQSCRVAYCVRCLNIYVQQVVSPSNLTLLEHTFDKRLQWQLLPLNKS